ncbi:MAG TPA: hypothetical protein VEW05_14480, partial [Candidatus Polarisedimenticolia bacterium]|nr:hypothetical protein [Candidatus Polarisedimenticolia bacterium]
MKKLLTILLLTLIASVSYAGALSLSFVQNWPDYSITVKVTAGSAGAPYSCHAQEDEARHIRVQVISDAAQCPRAKHEWH